VPPLTDEPATPTVTDSDEAKPPAEPAPPPAEPPE
jgi:hypothetical protein